MDLNEIRYAAAIEIGCVAIARLDNTSGVDITRAVESLGIDPSSLSEDELDSIADDVHDLARWLLERLGEWTTRSIDTQRAEAGQ